MAHAPPSDFQKIAELEEEQNKIRDILFFQSIHGVSQSNTFGQGRKSNILGSRVGGESWFPLESAITDIDLNDVATGIFDKLNLQSLTNVVVGPVGTLILKTIQHVSDGKIFSITPGTGRTVEITPGDNIEVSSTITLQDTDMAFMQFFKDTNKVKVISVTGSGATPAGTAENDHLEWDDTGKVWVSQQFLEFGAGIHPAVGNLRFKNNTIALAFRNFDDDGDIEVKIDVGSPTSKLDITENSNNAIILNLRAQHAIDPDQSLTFTQFSGTGGRASLSSPTQIDLDIGATGVVSVTVTGVSLNDKDLTDVTNIIGRDDGTPFKIIFDAAEDSDTFISDDTGTADRINVTAGGVSFFSWLHDGTRPIAGLVLGANGIFTISDGQFAAIARAIPPDADISNDELNYYVDTATDPARPRFKRKTVAGVADDATFVYSPLDFDFQLKNTKFIQFLDASDNQDIKINYQDPALIVDLSGTATGFVIVNAGTIPDFVLRGKNTADGLLAHTILFQGLSSTSALREYGSIKIRQVETLNASEDGRTEFALIEAGVPDVEYLRLEAGVGLRHIRAFKPLDMGSNKIQSISGDTIQDLGVMPAVDTLNDMLWMRDATDGVIKRVSPANLGIGGGGSSFADNVFEVFDDITSSKKITFQLVNAVGTNIFDIFGTADTYTFPDGGGEVIMSQGTQTIGGFKTFSGPTDFDGNVDIGNATSDTLTILARIDSDIEPTVNKAQDIGGQTLAMLNVYTDVVRFPETTGDTTTRIGQSAGNLEYRVKVADAHLFKNVNENMMQIFRTGVGTAKWAFGDINQFIENLSDRINITVPAGDLIALRSGSADIMVFRDDKIIASEVIQFQTFNDASRPTASAAGAGAVFYSNQSGDNFLLYSDGTNWRNVHDNTAT